MASATFNTPGARNSVVNPKVPANPGKNPAPKSKPQNSGGKSTGSSGLKGGVINPFTKA